MYTITITNSGGNMADIGVRSGKVRPGLYICGLYVIEKQNPSGWWYVWKNFNSNRQMVHQAATLADAYNWGRRNV